MRAIICVAFLTWRPAFAARAQVGIQDGDVSNLGSNGEESNYKKPVVIEGDMAGWRDQSDLAQLKVPLKALGINDHADLLMNGKPEEIGDWLADANHRDLTIQCASANKMTGYDASQGVPAYISVSHVLPKWWEQVSNLLMSRVISVFGVYHIITHASFLKSSVQITLDHAVEIIDDAHKAIDWIKDAKESTEEAKPSTEQAEKMWVALETATRTRSKANKVWRWIKNLFQKPVIAKLSYKKPFQFNEMYGAPAFMLMCRDLNNNGKFVLTDASSVPLTAGRLGIFVEMLSAGN